MLRGHHGVPCAWDGCVHERGEGQEAATSATYSRADCGDGEADEGEAEADCGKQEDYKINLGV